MSQNTKEESQSSSITATQAAHTLRGINSILGSDSNTALSDALTILKFINAPLKGSSDSYPNLVKVSHDLLMMSNTLDIFGDCDLRDLKDICKKSLVVTLHPVVKLYDGIY